MKKIFTTIIGFALSTAAMAQVKFGVEGGATYNMMSQRIHSIDRTTEGQYGYRFGVNTDIALASNLSLQTGVFFNGNVGSSSSYTNQFSTGGGIPTKVVDNRQYKVNQILIPVYLTARTGEDQYNDPKFIFGIGPYLGINVGGRFLQNYSNVINGDERIQDHNRHIEVGTDFFSDIAPIDFGGSVMVGYELPIGLYFKAHFGMGFLDLYPNNIGANKFNNMGGGISVGFNIFNTNRYYRY